MTGSVHVPSVQSIGSTKFGRQRKGRPIEVGALPGPAVHLALCAAGAALPPSVRMVDEA
jgi:hypothetical protein